MCFTRYSCACSLDRITQSRQLLLPAQAIAEQVPAQAEFSGGRPAATKLAVDPFLRIVGARDALALGDCAMLHGNRLPATAQVQHVCVVLRL